MGWRDPKTGCRCAKIRAVVKAPGAETEPAGESPPPPPDGEPSLAVRAAGSSVWSLIGQIFQVVLGTASFALLSRWLTPFDYGLLGMAATVSGFVGVIGDVGVSTNVIRIPILDGTAEATAFWVSLGGAVLLTVVSAIAAPILAHFYRNDAITSLSLALAATFLVAAPGRVSIAKLSRQLRFRASTGINIVANTVATALAVVLAARGFGAWALVFQGAATFALQSVLAIAVSPPHVRPALFSRTRAREFASFGSRLSGFSLAVTVARAPDGILAGRFLGSSAVGLMSMGVKLIFLPVERLCGAIYNVFLPATVELKDVAAQARAFQSAARLLMIVVGPFALGAIAIAPEVVALLPPQWAGMTPLLIVYGVTALLLPLNYLSLAVLVAQGHAGLLLRIALALIPLCWSGAVVGALMGSVLAMVCAWSFSIFVGAGTSFVYVWRYLQLKRGFWGQMSVPLFFSGVMALGVRAVLHLAALSGKRAGFALGAATGIVLYSALAWIGMRADVQRVIGLLRQAMARRRSGG
jgi:O-antigen/teichoic acid export membrane protein